MKLIYRIRFSILIVYLYFIDTIKTKDMRNNYVAAKVSIDTYYHCKINYDSSQFCPTFHQKKEINNGTIVCIKNSIPIYRKYEDKYVDCNGNQVPLHFAKVAADLGKSGLFWTDFQRAYSQGIFVNWNHGDQDMGKPLFLDERNILFNTSENYDEFNCLAIDLDSQKFIPRNCQDKLPRLCVSKPRRKYSTLNQWICKEDFVYYDSPIPTCLTDKYRNEKNLFGNGTRDEANEFCKQKSGYLIDYFSAYPYMIDCLINDDVYPLINTIKKKKNFNFVDFDGNQLIFPRYDLSGDKMYYAITQSGMFTVREKEFIFDGLVCEHPVEKPDVELKIQIMSNKLGVSIKSDAPVTLNDIRCFTDSVEFFPTTVSVKTTPNSSMFEMKIEGDGHYWCVTINMDKFQYIESNKFMLVKNEYNWLHAYDIQFKFTKPSSGDDISYVKQHYLKQFQNSRFVKSYGMESNSNSVILKRIYTDSTVVYRVSISESDMNKIRKSNLKFGDVLKMESLLCQQKFKSITTIDGSSITRRGNHSWICTSTGGFICRKFECYNESSICFYQFDAVPEISNIIRKVDTILKDIVTKEDVQEVVSDLNEIVSVPKKFLQNFDSILTKVKLADVPEGEIHSNAPNLVVGVAKIGRLEPTVGLMLRKEKTIDMSDNIIDFLNDDEMDNVIKNAEEAEIIVEMHSFNATNLISNLAVVVMQNERLFQTTNYQINHRIQSKIIGISTNIPTPFVNGQYVDIHLRPFKNNSTPNQERVCAYWDFDLGDEGSWSTDGCEIIETNLQHFNTCRCYHLTYFALINPYGGTIAKSHRLALRIITYCGCTASLIGLVILALTAILFEKWRQELTNKVYLNLSATIGLLMITFMSNDILEIRSRSMSCTTLGALLHYCLLANFSWMLIIAMLAYKKLVEVFDTRSSHRLLKVCICGWFVPLMPVLLLLIVNNESYSLHVSNDNGATFCYPSGQGFWFAVFMPILVIMVINTALFCLIVYNVFIKTAMTQREDAMHRSVTVSFLLFFMFGLTWIFGLFSKYILFNYLFCFTATMHGTVLCIFFVFVNEKTRKMWKQKINSKIFNSKNLPFITKNSIGYTGESETVTFNSCSRS
ncbi:uncharacterized protein LOC143910542 [Arctopsyche grandis]|uniref:uncharacterized protein LOC143910542 n=1 Tax=Arctopsyche grandis TaxID=121162 RepID=UPI00406D74AF